MLTEALSGLPVSTRKDHACVRSWRQRLWTCHHNRSHWNGRGTSDFLGFIPDSELRDLCAGARVMPVIEAAACGTKVVGFFDFLIIRSSQAMRRENYP